MTAPEPEHDEPSLEVETGHDMGLSTACEQAAEMFPQFRSKQ